MSRLVIFGVLLFGCWLATSVGDAPDGTLWAGAVVIALTMLIGWPVLRGYDGLRSRGSDRRMLDAYMKKGHEMSPQVREDMRSYLRSKGYNVDA